MAETSPMEVETLEQQETMNLNIGQEESDASSDSDSDDEDIKENLMVETLEKEIGENPSSYEAHVQYIKCLRKLGDIEKLRQARESMNAIFPLTPAMWQEWAKDEASLITGNGDFLSIEKLYERGVNEYLFVPLWCDYVHFVKEYDPSVINCTPNGISKMRDLLERSLSSAGLHVVEGNKIWEAYLEFEQKVLQTYDQCDSEEKKKQVQRVRSIFHRRLSVPLAESRSMLLAYKAWEAEQGNINGNGSSDLDGISSHVASAYQKAVEMYNARAYHEEQISKKDALDTERLQHFMGYLNFEKSSGDPSRTQILYERAITEFPVSSDLWLDFTRFLDQTLKASKIVLGVYSRATKNCPWIGELWVRYLLCLERNRASEKELFGVFEQSLLCTFSSFEEYLDLFLTRIDGLRRRYSQPSSAEDVVDYAVIRDTFQRATEYLSEHLKNTEGLLHLYAYWARLERNLGKDLVAARGVWESLLKTSGAMLEAWQRYIMMEIETGHLDAARSIYRRCYTKSFVGSGSEEICHSWVRFEREFGTLEEYDNATNKVKPRLNELQLFKLQQESKAAPASVLQKEDHSEKKSSQKRKPNTGLTEEHPMPKRQKGTAEDQTRLDTTENVTVKKNVELIAPKAEKPEPAKVSTSKAIYKDQCTAFISNLNFKVKEEDLRNLFKDIGGVTAIRILKDKFTGKSRGLAYVDFSDAEHLAAAVKKNKQTLLGKKMSIAYSNPKRNKEPPAKRSKEQGERAEPATESGGGTDEMSNSEKPSDTSKETATPHAATTASQRRGDRLQLTGKNTFAVPRNVARSLGDRSIPPKKVENEEILGSNDEFRKMLLKK